ncbi:MAG: DUF3416 domain-containing protein, partial [Alphaproteobacteria bacterium]|nr:DUF3416 domain-containing protein [Alphaproteobacteria bacterium]
MSPDDAEASGAQRADAGTVPGPIDAAPGRAQRAPLIYHLNPRLASPDGVWSDNLPRLAAMGFDAVYIGPSPSADIDGSWFATTARQHGLDIMADLALEAASPDAVDAALNTVLRPLLHDGVNFFRCVAAHRLPPESWRALIAAIRKEAPLACFCADTLGAPIEATLALGGVGFDFVFNSVAWWDGHSAWFLEQQEKLRRVAPTIGFPVPLDGETVVTDPVRDAARSRHRYALAAACSSGLIMPMGFEHGGRVRRFDISDFISEFNAARLESPALLVDGSVQLLSPSDDPVLALARASDDAAEWAFLLLNRDVESGRAVATDALLAAAEEQKLLLERVVPEDDAPVATAQIELEPLGLCLLIGDAGQAGADTDRPTPAKPHHPLWRPEARVAIESIAPVIDGGRFPAKRIVGDAVEVTADILRDGHDVLAATLKYRHADDAAWRRAPMRFVDNDRWGGRFVPDRPGRWLFVIDAWTDHFASWRSEIEKKRKARQDVAVELLEGRALVAATMARADARELRLLEAVLAEIDAAAPEQRFALLSSRLVGNLMARQADRSDGTRSPELEILAGREEARCAAWYEMFPRSQGRIPGRGASFDDCIARLPEIAALGFDVVYLVPIHPIGRVNRKGRDNAVTAAAGDPGSPYAIGAVEGGHCAVNPELGTIEDFRRFVAAAASLRMEIALDFAVQCAPDHPWVRDHRQWFIFRPDGTIKYAENPPKKYQDIVNVDFYNSDRETLWRELRDVILFWAGEGVRIFRVDNPHTKPVPFWEWCIGEVLARYPDVIFLSEAFTRPKMMKLLAKAGFTQSYSYFTWRNTKAELTQYLTELTQGPEREYMQPNFFTNTPDILPRILQEGGRPAFRTRFVLAATLSPAYGIYNGFELCEGTPIPNSEEYLHSEKYEYKVWDWDRPGNIKDEIAALNRFRRT